MNKPISLKPFVIIDMMSGSYVLKKTGHECFNLVKNPVDGRYYGYCPPYGSIDITRLGAEKSAESIEDVMVIYTKKVSGSSNREVIAFTESARVFHVGQLNESLKRTIPQEGKIIHCSYAVVSESMHILENYPAKFIIDISKYNTYMFRGQRVFKGQYKKLDKELLNYLEEYLLCNEEDNDLAFQAAIQKEDVSSSNRIVDSANIPPQTTKIGGSDAVKKNARISKQALFAADFKCAGDITHTTFPTTKGFPYMEGHHLIPCTYSNSQKYWKEKGKNIDCEENIMCLCPTCHRRIHFGSPSEKKEIISLLYKKQKSKLKKVGLDISLEELLDLYK